MRKGFKKLATVVLVGAMTVAMAVTAMASSYYDEERLNIGSKGYADCYVYAGTDSASADTSVYASYSANYIYAYASVDLTVTFEQTGYESSQGSDYDSESNVGSSAYAEAYVPTTTEYHTGTKASSFHSAEIDGIDVCCGLYAEN